MPILEFVPAPDIQAIQDRLTKLFPPDIHFDSLASIEALTDDQAMAVMRAVRRRMLYQLLSQEHHEHMGDDCGDDLEAATYNWSKLWNDYFMNDGTDFTAHVKKFLLAKEDDKDYPWGGVDGEVRYGMISESIYSPGEEE